MEATLVRSCFAQSTAHGITYVANGKTILQRVAWLLFFLAACGAFGYYLQKNIQKYYSEPVSMTIVQRGAKFIAPDLHFCSLSSLARSRMLDPHTLNSPELQELQQRMQWLESVLNSSGVDESSKTYYLWSSISHERLFSTLGHLAPQMVTRVENIISDEVTSATLTPTPNCYYFTCLRFKTNSTKVLRQSWNPLFFYMYTDTFHLTKTPLTFLNRPLDRFNFVLQPRASMPSGVMLVLTPPNAFPHLESTPVFLSPGRYTTVSLRMQRSVATDTRRAPCQSEPQYVEYVNRLLGGNQTSKYMKTLTDCKYHKVLERMFADYPECRCVPYMTPVTLEMAQKYPICHDLSRLLAAQNSPNLTLLNEILNQFPCISIYFRYDTAFDYTAECKEENPCETLSYYTDISSSEWPLDDVLEDVIKEDIGKIFSAALETHGHLPGLEEYLRDIQTNTTLRRELTKYNLAKVEVKVGETHGVSNEESLSYDVENLISDAGGLAGLYLGMSFLTVLEFFNLAHDLILLRIEQRNTTAVQNAENRHADDYRMTSVKTEIASDSAPPSDRMDTNVV